MSRETWCDCHGLPPGGLWEMGSNGEAGTKRPTDFPCALRCDCGECGGLWLSRAERPERGIVTFPALGVFDFQVESSGNRVTFASVKEAEGVRAALASACERPMGPLSIVPVVLPDGHTPGRLEGR